MLSIWRQSDDCESDGCKSDRQYKLALKRIEALMDTKANTPGGDELELLATLVELYEEKRFPIDHPTPIEAVRFRMEQAGLSQRDLAPTLALKAKSPRCSAANAN